MSATVGLASLALGLVGGAKATSPERPSDRACLIAWNSPANEANHVRLLAQRPIAGLVLGAAVTYTVTWKKGSPPTETSHQACVMTISKRRRILDVTGIWKGRGVSRWTFGRVIPASGALPANVRLLPDGRVTKIYLR